MQKKVGSIFIEPTKKNCEVYEAKPKKIDSATNEVAYSWLDRIFERPSC